jgi:hypothetical protein
VALNTITLTPLRTPSNIKEREERKERKRKSK